MYVIGAAGQAQNGKDSLCDYLWLKLMEIGHSWTRSAFAKNVKKVFSTSFEVSYDFIEEWKTKPECPPGFDMPMRPALQFIGDGFRKIQSKIWLDMCFRGIEPKIISDVRYINEFLRIYKEGGLNILVGRTDRLNDDPNGSEAEIRPFAEWALKTIPAWDGVSKPDLEYFSDYFRSSTLGAPTHMDKFHIFVRNDGTKEDLYKQIDEWILPLVVKFPFTTQKAKE